MRFTIDWANHIVGSKFTVFALFYFVFEGNFPSTSPRGAYIWRGDLTEGFLRYEFGGLIFGGAYTWRGFFSEFYGIKRVKASPPVQVCRSKYLCFKSVERLFPADNTENLKNKGNYEFLRKNADFDTFTN